MTIIIDLSTEHSILVDHLATFGLLCEPIRLCIRFNQIVNKPILLIVNINRFQARITRQRMYNWDEQRSVEITWDPVYLGLENTTVSIELARYSITNDGQVFLHSMYSLRENQLNNGRAAFFVPRGQGSG